MAPTHRITTRERRSHEAASSSRRRIGAPAPAVPECEEELVRGILSGSFRHFDRFYEEYFSRVHGFALQHLGDPGEAERATQDVFVVALRALQSWRCELSLPAWIFGITLNVVNQRHRRIP